MHPSFTECYYDLVAQVYQDFEHECAPRDQKIRESLGVGFAISNPRNRLLYIPERQFSLTYAIAEMLWYLLGNDRTDWISNYSAFWADISDDGQTANSAYGARIFRPNKRIAQGRFTQWEYVKNELQRDPDSRRAVIHIRTPDDSIDAKLDVPCTLSLQFFIRSGKLHMMTNMRSTDLIFGLSYDVPAFTMFQELLALELGVELGNYMHVSNSLHIYDRHFEMSENILKGVTSVDPPFIEMPAMPAVPTTEILKELDRIQWNARSAATVDDLKTVVDSIATADLGFEYWRDWAKILVSHRARKLKDKPLADKLVQSTDFVGYHKILR